MLCRVLPYQELLGNYNTATNTVTARYVLPYQELLGNYNLYCDDILPGDVLPYQELLGNYNGKVAGSPAE